MPDINLLERVPRQKPLSLVDPIARKRGQEPPASIDLGSQVLGRELAVAHTGARDNSLAFQSRFIVLQAIGVAGIASLWIAGVAEKPFVGINAFVCSLIAAMGVLGVVCVYLQRWRDAQWLATHVVRIGLLGTVVGLIVAFSAAKSGASSDPNAIRSMIAAVVDGMYVSLYATLFGVATNLWLKINLRLIGNIDG